MTDELITLGKLYPLKFLQDLVDLAMATAGGARTYDYNLDEMYQQVASLVHEIFLIRTAGAVSWELIPSLVVSLIRHVYFMAS